MRLIPNLVSIASLLALFLLPASPTESGGEAGAMRVRIVNLKAPFSEWWNQARGKPASEAMGLFDRMVYRIASQAFDSLVFDRSMDPEWENKKGKRLEKFIGNLPEGIDRGLANFDPVEETVRKNLSEFRRVFPDADLGFDIYVLPSLGRFDAKVSVLPDGLPVMGFGVDVLAGVDRNPRVLIAHEVFHVLNLIESGLSEDWLMKNGTLAHALWMEGLATLASGRVTGNSSDSELLFDVGLGNLSSEKVRLLAGKFLEVSGSGMADEKNQKTYEKWFSAGSKDREIPCRAGYRLGLEVARAAEKDIPLEKIAAMPFTKVQALVDRLLKKIADGD